MTNYTFQSLFDFTRTTSGTFVGSNGLIQTTPASVNLLLRSQEFDNAAWTKGDATVTANATTAPDGTSTADLLTETATSNFHFVFQAATTAAGAATATVYAKLSSGSRNLAVYPQGTTIGWAIFNLATGVITTSGGGALLSSSITAVGNGWYRCSVTWTASAVSSNFVCYLTNSTTVPNASYLGDGTSGIFLWGAQLQTGSTATDYTRNNGGVYPARFDYDPATLQPKGILIEEQRVNVILTSTFATLAGSAGSQYPSGTGWSNFFSAGGTRTYVASSVFAGAQAMDIVGVTAARNLIGFSFAAASSTTYTVSFYVESVSGATGIVAYATGALGTGGTSNNITAPTTTGRYSYTFTTGTSAGTVDLRFGIGAASNESGSIRISNVQCEAGAFATSYIPTVASQVTRTADTCTIVAPLFAPWFNQSAGTFVFEGDVIAASQASHQLGYNVSGGTFPIALRFNDQFGAGTRFLNSDASLDISASGTLSANVVYKVATAYSGATDAALTRNGGTVGTDTAYNASAGNTGITLGANGAANANFLNGHIRSIRYYPVRLADFQLQALTA